MDSVSQPYPTHSACFLFRPCCLAPFVFVPIFTGFRSILSLPFANMAMEFGTGLATNATNAIIGILGQQLKDVRELGKNLQLLNNELDRMEGSLRHIQTQFEDQQKKLPDLVEDCLGRINNALEQVKTLIQRANTQRQRCRGCCLFFSPNIPADIREWNTGFAELFQQLHSALSTVADTAQIVGSAQPQAESLLQPLPESGFVGTGIEAAQRQLSAWLNEPHPLARVVGVWGMAGVGKTALLQLIYNNCKKKKVSGSFDFVIWYTISQNYQIQSLQDTIAESLNLKFEPSSNIDQRKMKLYASLENKRFLLVLDDAWNPIDLNEVGINFGHDNSSKLLMSSRYRDVVELMAQKEYCMMIRPLSTEEGWELFRRRAFRCGAAPDNNLEVIARQVALECKGLPLAINTVAATMARKKTADEWSRALVLMRNVDPSFPSTHRTIDAELYQRIRWSYNDLPDNLKMCFLYCAAFPEDAHIYVETLVEMWTAERLVPQKGTTYFMDVGVEYIEALVDRCLIEYVGGQKGWIKVHDVLRDMAIHVGQGEQNWLFEAGQGLQHFPCEEETRDRKRISVLGNKIKDLPTDLKCPTLVSLVLAKNYQLKEIPEGFLVNSMSLKVLDLSYTSIETLPTTVGQLTQLEFLNLKCCKSLEHLPDSICNLSHLQFLNLEGCPRLDFLPDRIGELKNLKHLTVWRSDPHQIADVRVIPHQIYQLTSLNKLVLPYNSIPLSLEDLTNLSNLIELNVTVKPEIKGGSMSTWSKMRRLSLRFEWGEDENRDDAALDILPHNMQSMKELQSLQLINYEGVSLPNCICQFQNLKDLELERCMKLEELSALEIGSDAARDGFPKFESLYLSSLESLESIVCNAKTMPQLHGLTISDCGKLKTLRIEELTDLGYIQIFGCPQLEVVEISSLPMLRTLRLVGLEKAESIARPSSVWNEETMPNLEDIRIRRCPLLRRMPKEMEKLPKLKKIEGESDWWDGISWENDDVKSKLSHLFKVPE